MPEPIFIAAMLGVERILRIGLDPADPDTWLRQALNGLGARLKQLAAGIRPLS